MCREISSSNLCSVSFVLFAARWNKHGSVLRCIFSGRRDGWRLVGAPLLIYDVWRHLQRPAGTPGRDLIPQLCKPSLEKQQPHPTPSPRPSKRNSCRWPSSRPAFRDACHRRGPGQCPRGGFHSAHIIKYQRQGEIFNGGGLERAGNTVDV